MAKQFGVATVATVAKALTRAVIKLRPRRGLEVSVVRRRNGTGGSPRIRHDNPEPDPSFWSALEERISFDVAGADGLLIARLSEFEFWFFGL